MILLGNRSISPLPSRVGGGGWYGQGGGKPYRDLSSVRYE